jgi:hypothetical protein
VTDKKSVVLIPYWVQEALRRNGLQLSACLDLDLIRPFVATNDLASFLTLQDNMYFNSVIGATPSGTLIMSWNDNVIKTNSELSKYLNETLSLLAGDKTIRDDIDHRLFSTDSGQERHKEPFVIYDLTPDVIGVVIYPGYFVAGNNAALQKDINEAIIEVLYRYSSFHEVAQTPFFRRYLELLQGK